MKRTLACALLPVALLLSGCGDDGSTEPTADTTPPSSVDDLAANVSENLVITLFWTAPGDDGDQGRAAAYEIRYSTTPLTESAWDTATPLPATPTPAAAGEREAVTVPKLPFGTWHFALKSADEVPNWSALSNVVTANLAADAVPPARTTDLSVSVNGTIMQLSWTAPGDDGDEGTASTYDVRYATETITDESWDGATPVEGEPSPAPAGGAESFDVTGLDPGVTYFFALRTADEAPGWSELSNVVSGTTTYETRLTDSRRALGARSPSWSPDGTTIAFSADWVEHFYNHVYLVPAVGGEAVRLRTDHDYDFDPSWSPDGERIVFVSERVSGMNPRELWISGSSPGSEAERLTGLDRNLSNCAWSTDGDRIAFVGYTTAPFLREIFLVAATGGDPVPWSEGDAQDDTPAWSPDGSMIAFSSDRSGNWDVWVQPADGGEAVQLTDDPGWDTKPAWSADGKRIAFASNRDGLFHIWTMDANGDNPQPVTSGPLEDFAPSWSPDGGRIAFERWEGGFPDIWVIHLR